MKNQVVVDWREGMSFSADIDGHNIIMDAKEEHGGTNKGPTPKPLMLVALAGCTGMDVVSMLKKMKVEFSNFRLNTVGDLTEEHPKHYEGITIQYEFWGKNLNLSKIEKAVQMSLDKYCGVAHVYKQVMDVKTEIIIHED